MEYATIAGNYYTITSKSGCSVTDATGTLSMTVDAGGQLTVQAPSDKLVYDDEQAIIFKANFKQAALALGLLGGGKNDLPAGYTRLEFLESTGTQRIKTDIIPSASDGCELVYSQEIINDDAVHLCFGGNNTPNIVWQYGERGSRHADFCWMFIGTVGYAVGGYLAKGKKRTLRIAADDITLDGTAMRLGSASSTTNVSSIKPIHIFGSGTTFTKCKVWRFRFYNGNAQHEFIPALDPTSTPCLYDMVTRKPFYNSGSGSFIVGFTLAQAAQLGRKLPSTGASLTVSLPEGYDSNEAVVNSLAQAEAKGWVLTIQTYAAETAAATYSLRRVWVRRQQDGNGTYVDADGSRWNVDWCVDIIGADPESLGYERFRSVDAAVGYWELVPYQYPEEELSTEA